MFFDYTSLLVATGVAAAAAGLTFLVSWLSDKSGGFLATCSASMTSIAAAIALFLYFTATFDHLAGYLACSLLLVALSLAWAGARQFRFGDYSPRHTFALALVLVIATGIPYLAGFDGLSFVFINFAAGVLLAVIAVEYWHCRAENPVVITGISALYVLLSLSFSACGAVLLVTTPLVLDAPPSNWAESLNLAVSVLGVTGIGALSIALNHQRLVQRHHENSLTDALTGINNRRALFDRFGPAGLSEGTAIIVFDLDHFKSINDRYGHAAGDTVLRQFASICLMSGNGSHFCARVGGEEFVIVISGTTPSAALATAESVRLNLAKQKIHVGDASVSTTVSVGLYVNIGTGRVSLDDALREADRALYAAKRDGRNRVIAAAVGDAA